MDSYPADPRNPLQSIFLCQFVAVASRIAPKWIPFGFSFVSLSSNQKMVSARKRLWATGSEQTGTLDLSPQLQTLHNKIIGYGHASCRLYPILVTYVGNQVHSKN